MRKEMNQPNRSDPRESRSSQVEAILFVSTDSLNSQRCVATLARMGILKDARAPLSISIVRLDSAEARRAASAGRQFRITEVPYLILSHSEEDVAIHVGAKNVVTALAACLSHAPRINHGGVITEGMEPADVQLDAFRRNVAERMSKQMHVQRPRNEHDDYDAYDGYSEDNQREQMHTHEIELRQNDVHHQLTRRADPRRSRGYVVKRGDDDEEDDDDIVVPPKPSRKSKSRVVVRDILDIPETEEEWEALVPSENMEDDMMHSISSSGQRLDEMSTKGYDPEEPFPEEEEDYEPPPPPPKPSSKKQKPRVVREPPAATMSSKPRKRNDKMNNTMDAAKRLKDEAMSSAFKLEIQ